MTLIQKFANLTPRQREKFAAIKDGAELDAFVSETNIDLTEEEKTQAGEYLKKGMLPLDDDDLDTVAGGATKDVSPGLAAADGRNYNLPSGNNLCVCHHENKWARSVGTKTLNGQTKYSDIKCYKCGKTWDAWFHQDPAGYYHKR